MNVYKTLAMFAVLTTLGLAGCKTTTDPAEDPGQMSPSDIGTTPLGGDAGDLQVDELNDPNSPLSSRVIYFDYDSAQIRSDAVDIVAAHGQYLARHPNTRIRLEGHADERGSREYNLGLGERRALSVKRLIVLQGAADGQVETTSYGEELPAAPGHDDVSWQQNRRVEIVYR